MDFTDTHAVAKHAKSLGMKLKLASKEDELGDAVEDGGAEDEEEERGELWGANKRAYYDADTAEYEVRRYLGRGGMPGSLNCRLKLQC